MQIFDSVEAAAFEAKAEIAAKANKIAIEPPKDETPPVEVDPETGEVIEEAPQEKDIDF
jgi:hypothetical protein